MCHRVLRGPEILIDAAHHPLGLDTGPVGVELGIRIVQAVAHPRERERSARSLDLGPIDVAVVHRDVDAYQALIPRRTRAAPRRTPGWYAVHPGAASPRAK